MCGSKVERKIVQFNNIDIISVHNLLLTAYRVAETGNVW